MIKTNLHTHTTLSDGRNTVGQYVEKATELGYVSLGISDHSKLPGEDWTVRLTQERYASRIRAEAERCAGKLDLFCGVELDSFSECKRELYDYVIASVHILERGGVRAAIDSWPGLTMQIKNDFFGGDTLKMCEAYFKSVLEHAKRTCPDIIGHYDLIALYGDVDEEDPDYIDLAVGYAVETMKWCPRFEVNTGALSRGLRKAPYPMLPVMREIRKRGGSVVISTDCHSADNLDSCIDCAVSHIKEAGFASVDRLTKNGFVSDEL